MRIIARVLALVFATLFAATIPSVAQDHPLDVDLHYTYLHTNILPGCNCFSMNGGGGSASLGVRPNLFAVADIDITHAGSITPAHFDLTLTTYTFGVRYDWKHPGFRLTPFGEFLLGASHANGSLAPGSVGLPGSSNAFAMRTGGGLDLPLNHRLSLRPIQVDYLMTDFSNGKDDRQNNLQIGAGIVIHLRPGS